MHVLDACERQREEICLANLVLQAVLIILDAFKKKKCLANPCPCTWLPWNVISFHLPAHDRQRHFCLLSTSLPHMSRLVTTGNTFGAKKTGVWGHVYFFLHGDSPLWRFRAPLDAVDSGPPSTLRSSQAHNRNPTKHGSASVMYVQFAKLRV